MIDEVAEAFLICIDGIICDRIGKKGIKPDEFDFIRCGDNYEFYSSSKDTLNKIKTVALSALHEFEFNIEFERDWTNVKITKSHSQDLFSKLETFDNQILRDNVHSMDYSFTVLELSKKFILDQSRESCKIVKTLLKSHPRSVKYILENLTGNMVESVSDFLIITSMNLFMVESLLN